MSHVGSDESYVIRARSCERLASACHLVTAPPHRPAPVIPQSEIRNPKSARHSISRRASPGCTCRPFTNSRQLMSRLPAGWML